MLTIYTSRVNFIINILFLANANFEVDGMADELSRTKEERDRYAEELRYTKERLTDSEIRLIKVLLVFYSIFSSFSARRLSKAT